MPPCVRTCCRAVQRQLLPPADSIWVSDDALSSAFHRLVAISRSTKRNESSVPGPMESRRRLGRRRMAHVSQHLPATSNDLTSLWGPLGDTDRTQWQWQAPKMPLSKSKSATSLPSWLSQWDMSSQEPSSEVWDVNEPGVAAALQTSTPADDILHSFRSTMQNVLLDDVSETCDAFTQRFKQSIALGLASGEVINSALHAVTTDIRRVAPNVDFAESRCLNLYQAIWEGIIACKVLRPVDFPADLMNSLLSLLAELPLTMEVMALARSIIHSTSKSQLRSMFSGIKMLINAWSQTWLSAPEAIDCTPCLTLAEQVVGVSATRVTKAHKLVMALEEDPDCEESFKAAQNSLQTAKTAIIEGIEAANKVESILSPFKTSVEGLAEVIGNVPGELLSSLVSSCSDHISATCNSMKSSPDLLRYYWLSLIARMPNAGHQVLLDSWRKLETFRRPLKDCETSDLMLSHWISQGYVEQAPLIRNNFEAWGSRHEDLCLLLFTPTSQKQNTRTNPEPFFSMLQNLGRYEMVYDIVSRMLDLGIKVSPHIFVQTLDTTSNYSTRLALNLYKRYSPTRFGNHQLQLERCPNFVTAMIRDGTIPPRIIWTTLKIPLYEEIRPRPLSSKALSPSMINLVHLMAIEFARAEGRSRRVALRNVMQCLHHLRMHRVPVRPELTRAIAHVGITKEVLRAQWVGQERMRWALGLISRVEGREVADTIDRTIYHWRRQLTENQRRRKREQNVLRVGPID